MNPDPTTLDDLDLSSFIDGAADPDVGRRLDDDSQARARLHQMRSARDLLAATPVRPLPDDVVDDLVATALAEGLGTDGGSDVAAPAASTRSSGVPSWLVAAVVVLLVGIGLTLVFTGRQDPEMAFNTVGSSITGSVGGDTAADRVQEDAQAPEAESGHGDSDAAGTAGVAGGVAPELIELGSFANADELRIHLKDGFPATEATASTTTLAGTEAPDEADLDAAYRCLGKVDAMFGAEGDPVHVGLATVADEPVVVYELPYRTDEGRDTTLVLAVGELTCIPVLSFQR